MLLDRLKALAADHMLDPAGVLGGNHGIHSETCQPAAEELVPFVDHVRNLFSGIREIDEAFLDDSDMILLPQILHGNADS